MKILVTGSNGQLGREMRNLLEQTHPGVTTYTDVAELDLTDAQAVRRAVAEGGYTHIVNCAAYTAVDRAEEDQALCAAINVGAVSNLAEAAAAAGARIVHISTDYVFDGTSCRPYRESDRVNPVSVYGNTKRNGEKALLTVCPDAVILRTAWLYSPYGKNFVKTMLRLGREKDRINVVSDQIGTPTYAADLAAAVLAVITARQWMPGIYHFSDEGACSWYDFTKAIHRIAGIDSCRVMPVNTEDYPSPVHRPAYSVLDKSLIKKTFSIEIPHWEESLRRCLDRMDSDEQ